MSVVAVYRVECDAKLSVGCHRHIKLMDSTPKRALSWLEALRWVADADKYYCPACAAVLAEVKRVRETTP